MKQIYHTSCLPGKSVGGSAGFQVRAQSEGINPVICNNLIRYLGYQLPNGMPPDSTLPEKAPVRLAYLDLPDVGYCVVHSCYVGKTPEEVSGGIGRWGNYFSHALSEIDQDITAKEVISSWADSFWKKEDQDPTVKLTLPGDEAFPCGGVLNETRVYTYFSDVKHRELFSKLLNAYLNLEKDQRIFVAAQPEEFAILIYALCLALPKNILKDLTFSTYENSPQSSFAKIVCGYSASNEDFDPISFSYNSMGFYGFNLFSGKCSQIRREFKYAEYATNMIAQARLHPIKCFLNDCEKYDVVTGDEIELFFDVYSPETDLNAFDEEKAEIFAQNDKLTHYVLLQNSGVDWLMDIALQSDSFLKTYFWDIVNKHVLNDSVLRNKLNEGFITKSVNFVKDGNLLLITIIFDNVIPNLHTEDSKFVLLQIFGELSSESQIKIAEMDWSIYCFIIKKWSELTVIVHDDLFNKWLELDINRFGGFLKMDLPAQIIFKGAYLSIPKISELYPQIVETLIQKNLIIPLIIHFNEKPEYVKEAILVFKGWYQRSFSLIIFYKIIDENSIKPALLKNMLEVMKDLDEQSVTNILEDRWKYLIGNLQDTSTLKLWSKNYILNIELAWINSGKKLITLNNLMECNLLNKGDNKRIEVWLNFFALLKTETISEDETSDLISDLRWLIKNDYEPDRDIVFYKIADRVFYVNEEFEFTKNYLWKVLSKLNKAFTVSIEELYKDLITYYTNKSEPLFKDEKISLINALLFIGINKNVSGDLAEDLLKQTIDKGDKKLFEKIKGELEKWRWKREERKKWEEILNNIKPVPFYHKWIPKSFK